MTIYSLYIFDRHCTCVYYQDWHRTVRPKTAVEGGMLPAVYAGVYPSAAGGEDASYNSNRNTLSSSSGVVVAVNDDMPRTPLPNQAFSPAPSLLQQQQQQQQPAPPTSALSFDEEAKLVYGVVLSLRNMIKKLSGKDEQFVNYQTSTYKLHLYETLSGYKFVILSDPNADSLRFVLRQIYSGPFLEYVVRNPLVPMDSKERGIDNEYFRVSTDRMIRGLTVFQ
ncbi:snare-like protein [Trametes elegans]|nr:snare-like protein [Trametes elegans]